MINENLQTLHIFNPLSSLLQLLSFLKLFSVLALILLFIVPRHMDAKTLSKPPRIFPCSSLSNFPLCFYVFSYVCLVHYFLSNQTV
jgi:hypothetical protein